MEHLDDTIPMTGKEKAAISGAVVLTVGCLIAIVWMSFLWWDLHSRQEAFLSGQAEDRSELSSLRSDYADAHDKVNKAVEAERRMRELADDMANNVHPFSKKAGK